MCSVETRAASCTKGVGTLVKKIWTMSYNNSFEKLACTFFWFGYSRAKFLVSLSNHVCFTP